MLEKLRVKLARFILGRHCTCYQCGYHKLTDHSKKKKS